ncbi:MAG: YkgJ family cysteine cluster protein [Candidatus Sumerlaeaceae bacterium]|nr:YkgJ family cysteine cluster protein [Candidatus Sumerlaeaceae bacterium]
MSDYQLREFVCLRCGNCCRGEGIVRVGLAEALRIADYLGVSVNEFFERYTKEPETRDDAAKGLRWLLNKPGSDQECIFLEENCCRIHTVKPEKCRTFPLAWRTRDVLTYCAGLRA